MALQAGTCPFLVHRTIDSHLLGTSRSPLTVTPAGRRSYRGASQLAERAPYNLWSQRISPVVSLAVQSADADGEWLASVTSRVSSSLLSVEP